MKNIIAFVLLVALSGCGYQSVQNELIGQAKKVVHHTPIICPDYDAVDISLGVMRNGVGSMSTQDLWLTVPDKDLIKTLQLAVDGGKIVKIKYDEKRFTWCVDYHILTGVEILP